MGRLQQFDRDGLTFDVLDQGPSDGEAVVLLHGFPQNGACWHRITPRLHEAGLRTLAPDQRGSSPAAVPSDAAAYTVQDLALDVIALLDAAGLARVHLVGHDWGGVVAWAVAGRYPQRLHSLTSLSTPHPTAFGWAATHGTQALRSWYMGLFQLRWLPERVLRRTLAGALKRSGMPDDDVAACLQRMADPHLLSGALAWYRALPYSLREPTPASRVPTTFIWGRNDFAFGRTAVEKTRELVAAPYRFVELDAGHWLPETRPVQVASVLLDRVRAGAEA
jgi:pimeloyl-ACP methyl ester carboxylesterase